MLRAAALVLDGAARKAPPAKRLLRAAALAIGALFWAASPAAASEGIEVRSAELRPADGEAVLDAVFDFDLPWTLEDAVNRGIALYFVVEFELYRTRWFWFDERRAAATLTTRLTYSPLTRQYRLARGALALPFDTLGEALVTLRRVSGWTVIERGALTAGENYRAQVRMRLDTAQLPRPFQIGALTGRDWTLASEWRNVPVGPELARRRTE
jgi:hypothetical protein